VKTLGERVVEVGRHEKKGEKREREADRDNNAGMVL